MTPVAPTLPVTSMLQPVTLITQQNTPEYVVCKDCDSYLGVSPDTGKREDNENEKKKKK